MKQRENGSGQCYKTVSAFSLFFGQNCYAIAKIARIPDGNILVSDPRETQRILKKSVRKTFVFSKSA